MHLGGFIIRIYHDARSPERQIRMCKFAVFTSFDNFRFIKTLKTAYVLASKTKLQHHTEYFLVSLQHRKSGQLAKR